MRREFNNILREFLNEDFLTNFHYDPFFNLPKLRNKNNEISNNKDYSQNSPATNVFEDEWSYKFELSTPGFTKKDLKIELDNNVVTICGERKVESKKEGEYISKEYHSTQFHRSFTLPENVVADEIHAKSQHGITTLFLPKVTPTKSKNLTKTIAVE